MPDVSSVSPSAVSPSAVSPDEWETWRAIYSMRKQLDLTLERQLHRDADISLPDYEVLLELYSAEDRQLRARELGTRLGWEKSRLSHQVTRMERRGLLERTNCDTDARGTWILITTGGRRAVLAAIREHATNMRKYFFDVATAEELEVMRGVAGRVLDAIDPQPCDGANEPNDPDDQPVDARA